MPEIDNSPSQALRGASEPPKVKPMVSVVEDPQKAIETPRMQSDIVESFNQNKVDGITSGAYEMPEVIDPQEEQSFLEDMRDAFLTQTTPGVAIDYVRRVGSEPSLDEFDPDFDASKDPELAKFISNMSPDEVETFSKTAYNKEHYLELMGLHQEQKERQQRLSVSYQQSPIGTFLAGMAVQPFEPINYLIPYGGVAKGISKATRGMVRLNNSARGLTTAQALMRRMAISGLDNATEEVMIQNMIDGLSVTPVEHKGMIALQALAFGAAFSGIGAGVGKAMDDYKADSFVSQRINRLSKDVMDDLQIDKINRLIELEDQKISTQGQLSTVARDAFIKVRDEMMEELEIRKVQRAGANYQRDLQEYRRSKQIALANKRFADSNKAIKFFGRQESILIEKKRRATDDNVLRNEFIGIHGKFSNKPKVLKRQLKQFKAFKKRRVQKANREFTRELTKMNLAYGKRLDTIEKNYEGSVAAAKEATLPLPSREEIASYKESLGNPGVKLSKEDYKNILEKEREPEFNSKFEALGDYRRFLPKDPLINKLISKTLSKSNEATQIIPDLVNKLSKGRIDFNSTLGRVFLNKTAVYKGGNEIAAGLMDLIAPSYGRKIGELSVIERQEAIKNITAGKMSKLSREFVTDISKAEGRSFGLRSLDTIEHELTYNLRDYLINPTKFMSRNDLTPEVKSMYAQYGKKFDDLNKEFLQLAKDSGLQGADEISFEPMWFTRNWNNEKIREFTKVHGTEAWEDLVLQAFIIEARKSGEPIDMPKLEKEAAKFAYAGENIDLEDVARRSTKRQLLEELVDQGDKSEVATKRLAELKRREDLKTFGLTGARKPIDLDAVVEVDGTTFHMKDFLHSNVLATQQAYFDNLSGRIALAERGFSNGDILEEWVDKAVALERQRGNKDHARYLDVDIRDDIKSILGIPRSDEGDGGLKKALRAGKAYMFSRLLQNTGLSSFAELGSASVDAGVGILMKQYGKRVNSKLSKYLSFLSPDEAEVELTDALMAATGIGQEAFNYNTLPSTINKIYKQSNIQPWEQIALGETARLTRIGAPLEKMHREIVINSMMIQSFNRLVKNKKPSYIMGGLSDTNLAEMGLGMFEGKTFRPNEMYARVQMEMQKASVTEKGSLRNPNFDKWDPEVKRAFVDGLIKLTNHHMVNPDSVTAKGWHSSTLGQLLMQFRSFELNATSKVTGRAMSVLGSGITHGDSVELAKFAQKTLMSALFGKLALTLTAVVSHAGKEDYAERVQQAIWDDDAGVANIAAPIMRSSFAAGAKPIFETFGITDSVSTYGRSSSLSPFKAVGTTPIGQFSTLAGRTLDKAFEGDLMGVSQGVLQMSPLYRVWGLNVFANMYLDL